MRRRATSNTTETDETLTWLFAGQVLLALIVSFLSPWLR